MSTKICTSIDFLSLPKKINWDEIDNARDDGKDPPVQRDVWLLKSPDDNL